MVLATLIIIMVLLVALAYCIGRLNNKVRLLRYWVMQNRKEINRISDGAQLPDFEDSSI